MNKTSKFETIGELFCGPGGSGLGASMSTYEDETHVTRMKHLWALDSDNDSCKTYKRNISLYQEKKMGLSDHFEVFCSDINSSDIDLTNTDQFPYVDGLIFGFPCNDFSLVGKSKGLKGKFGPLYKHGITVLTRDKKPKWFIAENVSGISSANNGRAFDQIKKEMKDAGYRISVHKYKFEEYGVPQTRHRYLIVGLLNELNLDFKIPKPENSTAISAGEALKDIPQAAPNQERTRQSSDVVERLKHILPGQNAWTAEIPRNLQLNVPNTKLSHIYRRLHPQQPAYTVTASGGGGTHMYHWDEPRALTNRERARLQTFPDWFEFMGTKESVRKQIGMAIPPKGMMVICNALLATLNGQKYESLNANVQETFHELWALNEK